MTGAEPPVIGRVRSWLGARHESTIVSGLVLLYVLASSLTWAFVTPPGGAPNEPSHIAYAAAEVRGEVGLYQEVNHPNPPKLMVVTVPEWIGSFTDPPRSVDGFLFPCFRLNSNKTANCAPSLSNSTIPTAIPTLVTRYPPPYYWLVGVPTLVLAGDNAVYAMRVIAALLATGLIALGLTAASPRRRRWLALAVGVGVTPTVAHLFGSVNPIGMEIAAATGLGVALIGMTGDDTRNPRRRNALIVFLATALAWSRPLSFLTLAAVVGAGVLLNRSELRTWFADRGLSRAVAPGIAIAATTALVFDRWFRGVAGSDSAGSRVIGDLTPVGVKVAEAFREVERRIIEYGLDLVGRFGWSDHTPPESIRIGWAILIASLVIMALVVGTRRDRFGLVTVMLGSLVVAPVFMIVQVFDNPTVYQARYVLPLAVLVVIGAMRILGDAPRQVGPNRTWIIPRWGALLVPVAMLLALAGSFHRYSIGGVAQLSDLWTVVIGFHEWMPPAVALAGAGVAVSVMFASGLALFSVLGGRKPSVSEANVDDA